MLTVLPPFPNVRFHLLVTVLGANVALCGEEKLNVLLCCTKDRGKF
jgi:hypothetical protein